MRFALLACALAGLVASCTTVTPQEQRAANEARCRGYGFKPRTDAFAQCLQRIDLDRAADRRAALYDDPFFRYPGRGYYGRW